MIQYIIADKLPMLKYYMSLMFKFKGHLVLLSKI